VSDNTADDNMATSSDNDQQAKKRSRDVYDVTDAGDDRNGAIATPQSNKSRRSTGPGSAAGSTNKIKRLRDRASLSQNDLSPVVDPRVDAPSNLARAMAPDAMRLHPELDNHVQDSVMATGTAPEPFMGPSGDFFATTINASTAKTKPDEEPVQEPEDKSKERAGAETEAPEPTPSKTQASKPEPESATDAEDGEDGAPAATSDVEIAEVETILDHRMLEDRSLDMLVHWKGEKASEATWEPEQEVQDGASELLFDYWKKKGGRTDVVFKRKNEPEIYHVFRVVNHRKMPRGGFEVEVQWIGYPTTKNQTSWESETKITKIAPDLLQLYWDTKGGRSKFLAKRGRHKKNP